MSAPQFLAVMALIVIAGATTAIAAYHGARAGLTALALAHFEIQRETRVRIAKSDLPPNFHDLADPAWYQTD